MSFDPLPTDWTFSPAIPVPDPLSPGPKEEEHQWQTQSQLAFPPTFPLDPPSEISEDPLLLSTPPDNRTPRPSLKVKLDLRRAAPTTPTPSHTHHNNTMVATRGAKRVPSSDEDEYKEEEYDDDILPDADESPDVAAAIPPEEPASRYPKRSTRNSGGSSGSNLPPPEPALKRGKKRVAAEDDDEDEEEDMTRYTKEVQQTTTVSLHGRVRKAPATYADPGSDEDYDDQPVRGAGRKSSQQASKRKQSDTFIADEPEDEMIIDGDEEYGARPQRVTRSSTRPPPGPPPKKQKRTAAKQQLTQRSEPKPRMTRNSQRRNSNGSEEFDPNQVTSGSSDLGLPNGEEEIEQELLEEVEEEEVEEPEPEARTYSLRERKPVSYAIAAALDPAEIERMTREANKKAAAKKKKKVPTNGKGDVPRYADQDEVDSDDDVAKGYPAAPGGGAMFAGGAREIAPSARTLGKIGGQDGTADADPLGIDMSITFDQVGGLDEHIQRLKEQVFLPLQYPELFEGKHITPPKGVLFHGPPGTGKTLMARALAVSCSTAQRKVSVYVRKGADCLSKWVGEAERQLRLLFEEARNNQPAIIFFDEIDGLAPVRSSRQDQIHASIVSTLLALMDGMDSRGQVIVIGATNRPDAIDPALRRPGRFDREFYFPLPNLVARKKIIDIHTSKWLPPLSDETKMRVAEQTKGYGGADLRAVCTEAALNSFKRVYPQIYGTSERLLVHPEKVITKEVDFIKAMEFVIPSSARSTSSAAVALPEQLKPLLDGALEKTKEALDRALPPQKKTNTLEEAQWEEDDVGFAAEARMKAMETLRTYRPRILIYGEPGMGQNFIAGAALHHLEGYDVHSLDLGTLLSDSSRTPEAAVAQIFTEAKRHKPSILYIPNLIDWCHVTTQATRAVLKTCCDGLATSDRVLLLAIVEGPLSDVPVDFRAWFGVAIENRIRLDKPTEEQRAAFFADLIKTLETPPNEFGDAMPRKKRVLEELPIAPPLPPREPTAAELAAQYAADQRTKDLLRVKLFEVLKVVKNKTRRFFRSMKDDYQNQIGDDYFDPIEEPEVEEPVSQLHQNGTSEENAIQVDNEAPAPQVLVNGNAAHLPSSPASGPVDGAVPAPVSPPPRQLGLHDLRMQNMTGEIIHEKVYNNVYLSIEDFLADVDVVVWNAELWEMQQRDLASRTRDVVTKTMLLNNKDRLDRAREFALNARQSINVWFDDSFLGEIERMAQREKKRMAEAEARMAEQRAAKAKEEKGKAVNGGAIGTRSSARVNGLAPEFSMTDLAAFEKNKRKRGSSAENSEGTPTKDSGGERARKRVRISDSSEATGENKRKRSGSAESLEGVAPNESDPTGEERERKRLKTDHVGDAALGATTPVVQGDISMDAEPITLPTPMIQDVFTGPPADPATVPLFSHSMGHGVISAPEPSMAGTSGLISAGPVPDTVSTLSMPSAPSVQPEGTSTAPEGTEAGAVVREPSREPTPVPLPDFVLNPDLVEAFRNKLVHSTGELNIEELEQLRATSLDRIYRARAEWNRDPVAQTVMKYVETFVAEAIGDW